MVMHFEQENRKRLLYSDAFLAYFIALHISCLCQCCCQIIAHLSFSERDIQTKSGIPGRRS